MTTDETPFPHSADLADKRRQIADALISKYGDAASSVAARQIEAATGDARDTWEAIATLLSSDAARA